jgi:hypothetical protein
MDERGMDRLAEIARAGLPDEVDPARDAAGQERLISAIAQGAGRKGRIARRVPARWAAVLAAAAIAAAIALLWPAPRIGYEVEGALVAEAGYVAAPAAAEARVRFTDGSAVELTAGASMRVAELTPSGARVLLETGRASIRVAPRSGARWSVEAGPFAVLVTGTAFDLEWARGEETLRVTLREGAVVVRGPIAPDGVPLRAGQRLIARLREGDVQILSADATAAATLAPGGASPPPSPPGPEPAAPAGAQDPPASTPDPPGRAEPAARARAWSKRVADGDFSGVLAEAEQRGIDAVLAGGSLDEVVALGDAARYTGRTDLARRTLTTTRRRFPGSSAGRAAAFLLGRLADGGAPGQAIAWYDTYLSESPGGPFAAEALGRKMVATQRTAGRAAARPIAEQYLARHPSGAHAAVARDLIKP